MDDALFSGTEHDVDLLGLLRNAAARRHTLFISDTPDSPHPGDHPYFDTWYLALPNRLKWEVTVLLEQLQWVSVNTVTRGRSKRLLVSNQDWKKDYASHLELIDALRAASLPLHILVENQINDAEFLRRVMPPEWRNRLESWEKKGELRFVQGGGITEILKLLEFHLVDNQAKKTFGLPSEIWKQLHFIIYDHDGNQKSQSSSTSRKINVCCHDNGMENNHHQLERKKQENYLPLEALKIIASRITNHQDQQKILEQIIEYFSSEVFIRNFAELPKLGSSEFFKNEFSKPEYNDIWKDSWFENDGSWPEMVRLAESIASAM